ncbi:hypothetical protein PD5205_00436 [Xanthomonas fragariae]|uniref:Uncharacterized protein n=1 Tax=Xanthomonas fragariae TaxID=48664 RepID=A0A1Y6GTZ6_9XANT|nr:hypothetical protein NBC2815_00347 [Xanthomonas fragariae]SMR00794.1 hypothetical protein PD885_03573 [Xanthomonas fragariae]SMR01756.1 hypothetical protein PD5205_00436 [Xanthomonas fragariae]
MNPLSRFHTQPSTPGASASTNCTTTAANPASIVATTRRVACADITLHDARALDSQLLARFVQPHAFGLPVQPVQHRAMPTQAATITNQIGSSCRNSERGMSNDP